MTTKTQQKTAKRRARHARIRARVHGTPARPRLTVFRSNKAIYAQLIDDTTHTTLAAADSRNEKGTLTECATAVGTKIAELAKKAQIESVVFDRGGYKYQGTVAALADAARNGGLRL